MSDDAEFDAFLNGEGALARGLQGLAQPAPSAALDAAILANARAAMAQDARPLAANDSGDSTAAPQLARSLGWRWRMPAGIAAAVLVGVFAKQSYEASADLNRVAAPAAAESAPVMVAAVPEEKRAGAPAAEVALAPPHAPAAVPKRVEKPAPVQLEQASPQAAPPPPPPPVPDVKSAPPVMADEFGALARSAPSAPAPLSHSAPPAAMAPQKPQSSAPVAQDAAKAETRVVVNARANRVEAYSNSAAGNSAREIAQPTAVAPSGVMAEKEWLDRIQKLLAQGRHAEAVADWKAFREVYPNYPVPEEIRTKLE